MIYTVLRIEEDIDFGCEERVEGTPVKALVTLTDSMGEERIVRVPDMLLYERGIDEGMKVCFDTEGFLQAVSGNRDSGSESMNGADG